MQDDDSHPYGLLCLLQREVHVNEVVDSWKRAPMGDMGPGHGLGFGSHELSFRLRVKQIFLSPDVGPREVLEAGFPGFQQNSWEHASSR